ncbi:MAG: EAL domain-containing protein [Campylobacterota bacterium]|nr:EAL domain-containing protein [Campylobacterota bacterium]
MLDNKWQNIVEKIDFAFQPIVNIQSGRIYAVEALLRNHEKAGNYSSIFSLFDDAYHDGVLFQFDIKLRQKALKKFSKLDVQNIQIFYNLDNRLMYMPDYNHGNTSLILEELDLEQKSICFELSERGTLDDSSSISNLVNNYKQQGFDIAIDDFGTGVAGFQLLYYSEAKFIKIDRFFISNIQNDTKKRLFCKSIIDLAHIMNMKIIAEGVETKEEFYTCKDIGADLVQGYFVQKPKLDIKKIQTIYDEIGALSREDKRSIVSNRIDKTKINKIIPLDVKTSLNELFEYFKINTDNIFVPITDKLKNLIGVIYEKDIKKLSYSQFGIALAKNDTSYDKIKKFIKPIVSAEITWGVDKVLEVYNLNKSTSSNGIFVTKEGKYYGFIDLNNLLSLSYNRNIEIAEDQNPLTKLPGNRQIENYINNIFTPTNNITYHIVYFDFNDFKPFNDTYGFRQGDRAILSFSEILQKHLKNDVFKGHVGGDDFFIAFKDIEYKDIFDIVSTIQNEFTIQSLKFYNKIDKENGYVIIKDRFDIKRKFSLLSVSAGVIEINPNIDTENLDYSISKIKKASKTSKIPLGISLF